MCLLIYVLALLNKMAAKAAGVAIIGHIMVFLQNLSVIKNIIFQMILVMSELKQY